MMGMVQRHADLKVNAFPIYANYHLTSWERDLYANAMSLRTKFKSIIKERRAEMGKS